MLYIVGIGLSAQQLTLEALEILKGCEKIYIEEYTSRYPSSSAKELEQIIAKPVVSLMRKQVEEEFGIILEQARAENIALAVYGNPLNATTHLQILLDAKEKGIKARAIAGISIFEFVAFTGLERYKFGRTTSIVFHIEDYEPESFYDAIIENKKLGLHTLCLLDIKKEEEKMMSISHAISVLEVIEEKREMSALSESIGVGIAGAGSDDCQIKAGTLDQLKSYNFTSYPQCLIVCGKLNEKEIEALRNLSDLV
ncbi:MAG TPA: diphthine synthase [archaeon]|nr:diphthine synthase [archaeon]